MTENQGGGDRRVHQRRADDATAVASIGDRIAEATEGINRLADAVVNQTAIEGQATRETISRLDSKVHFVRIISVAALIMAFASVVGVGTLLWRSLNTTGPQIADQGQVLQDCLQPTGVCYQRNQVDADRRIAAAVATVTAQLRCDLGIECAPGVIPNGLPLTTTTTVPGK